MWIDEKIGSPRTECDEMQILLLKKTLSINIALVSMSKKIVIRQFNEKKNDILATLSRQNIEKVAILCYRSNSKMNILLARTTIIMISMNAL